MTINDAIDNLARTNLKEIIYILKSNVIIKRFIKDKIPSDRQI